MNPARLPHPRPRALRQRRDQHRRRRWATWLQHRCHLRLDQDRQTRRPPWSRQPALHPLDRARRGRVPPPHHRVRTPQSRSPTHQIPHSSLTTPKNVGATRHHTHQRRLTSSTTPDEEIPTRDCRRGNMKHPSPPSPTESRKRWWPGISASEWNRSFTCRVPKVGHLR